MSPYYIHHCIDWAVHFWDLRLDSGSKSFAYQDYSELNTNVTDGTASPFPAAHSLSPCRGWWQGWVGPAPAPACAPQSESGDLLHLLHLQSCGSHCCIFPGRETDDSTLKSNSFSFLTKEEKLSIQAVTEMNQNGSGINILSAASPYYIFYAVLWFLSYLNVNCDVSSPSRYSLLFSVTL